MREIAPCGIEHWFREHYFDAEIVLCNGGVEEFTLGELRDILCLPQKELDRILLRDSRSYGDPGLRQAIAQRWGKGDPERVLVTHGSGEAIYLIVNTLLRPGDEVVVLTPCYQALVAIAEAIDCRLKPWRLHFHRQFVPEVDEVTRLISPHTRMVILNFPHNPTGASLTCTQLASLIRAVAEVNAYLLWDAAFAELTYDGPGLPDPSTWYDRTISLSTLSKAYGLPGLRIGWCLAAPDILARCVRLRDYLTVNLSPLIEYVAQRAVESADRLLHLRLQQARRNLAILGDWVAQHHEFVQWVPPQGGVSAFLRLYRTADSEAFCRRLAQQCGVLLLPGTCFGFPEYVRLGFGGATAVLQEGLARIAHWLAQTQQVCDQGQ